MKQAGKKCLNLFVLLALTGIAAFTQAKSGLENYNLLSRAEPYAWMPVIHYETAKGQYLEARYNYESIGTFSLFGGQTFKGGGKLKYSTTPMIGFSTGAFEGISLANNSETEWGNFYLSSQSQYSFSSRNSGEDFFFNWTELGYSFSSLVFGGVSLQYTLEKNNQDVEPGLLAGLQFKSLSFPVYLFRPFTQDMYCVLGVNFIYTIQPKKQ